MLCLEREVACTLSCERVSELAVARKLAVFPSLPSVLSWLSVLLAVSAGFSELVELQGPDSLCAVGDHNARPATHCRLARRRGRAAGETIVVFPPVLCSQL